MYSQRNVRPSRSHPGDDELATPRTEDFAILVYPPSAVELITTMRFWEQATVSDVPPTQQALVPRFPGPTAEKTHPTSSALQRLGVLPKLRRRGGNPLAACSYLAPSPLPSFPPERTGPGAPVFGASFPPLATHPSGQWCVSGTRTVVVVLEP